MKIIWFFACLAVCCLAAPDRSSYNNEIKLTPEAEKLLEELVEIAGDHDPSETDRTRRTSNFLDKKKFSLGSISSFHHDDKYDKVHDYEHKAFNLWGLKKAIFVSLLQAIKAITGGVIAVKGHLIKGGGKILETSGRIVEHKGAAVTELGKHIAIKALSKPINLPEYSGYGHTGYGHHQTGYVHQQTGYGVPPVYGPPSTEHHHYYHPDNTGPSFDFPHLHAKSGGSTISGLHSEAKGKTALPDGIQAGLVVLKPINNQGHGSASHGEKPLAPTPNHDDNGFYKFTSTGNKEGGFYKFDPIGDYSEPAAVAHEEQPASFFSQSVPTTYYDKPSISRSIDYSYFVPQY